MGVHDGAGQLKPSRSEDGGSQTEEEQAKHAQQLKEFLKATTPSRSLKPSRSENVDDGVLVGLVPKDSCKAMIARFDELEADGELLHMEGGAVNDDSYVEALYYDDLRAMDTSLHHATGSGFIALERAKLPFTMGNDSEEIVFKFVTKTNPATNEWQPSPAVNLHSESKVHRSDP